MKKYFLQLCFLFALSQSIFAAAPMFEFYKNLDWSGFFDKMKGEFDICSCEIENVNQNAVGVKLRYVEPIMGLSLSNTPWNIVGMGMKMDNSIKRKQGTSRGDSDEDNSFMFKYINAVIFPILGWTIGAAQDYMCFERGTFLNMAYFSEIDPSYNSDVLGLAVATASPASRVWFANPIAEAACLIDCTIATSLNRPINSLYFCNGCNGSIYAANTGYNRMGLNIVNSEMIAMRMLSQMHTYGGMLKTADVSFTQNPFGTNIRSARCKPRFFPGIVKEQYLLQLPNNDMQPLGRIRFQYDFKTKPTDEDNVFFWLWRMRDICVGATKCRSTFTGM